jgi:RNase H-fold protein (predicted Holliday junction resolvase)
MSGVLGIDPGMKKAGYALLEVTGLVVTRGIEPIETLEAKLKTLLTAHPVVALAIGAGTNARAISGTLSNLGVPIELVDERDTTLRARRLYYAENRAPLWQRLLPLGLRFPPRPIDDYAAELIARRFLALKGERAAPS